VEIYEREIAFYALLQEIPFQSQECPYMHESVRTELREFMNNLENNRPGIKYNAYNSMMKISKQLRAAPATEAEKCSICGRCSTGSICSVCRTASILKQRSAD
jgi:uncharacterized protein (TIGR00269 family)